MKQKVVSRTSSSSSSSSAWVTGVTAALAAGGISAILTLILSSIVIGALIWIVVRRFVRPTKGRLPPGPIGLPILGVTPFLKQNPQIQLTEWGNKYGSIFSAYFGPNLTVVLNDYEAIKATYVDKAEIFTGRPDNFIFRTISRGYHGVLVTEGPFWREQRRFLMRSFHELGVGKSRFEQLCMEEAQSLVQAMLAHAPNAEPFDPRHEVDSSVANIIVGLTFGIRFDRKDAKLRKFLDNQYVIATMLNQAGALQVLPFLRYFPPFSTRFRRFQEVVQDARNIIEPEIRRIEAEYDPQQDPNSVTEFLLQKRAKDFGTDAAAVERAEHDQFSNSLNIITNIQVLFGAGTETSVTTLTWCILFLLRYPEMQQRCYDEIVSKVGTDRAVNWDDRNSLPFVDAFMHEVWRRANVIPLGVARRTMEDTYVNGYFIPKGTMTIPNMWNVHRDPRSWDQPLKFNPERFLETKQTDVKTTTIGEENEKPTGAGDKMIRTLTNMPFGTGKRQCAGEGIARMEIFLFLATMIQQIEFCHAPEAEGGKLPGEDDFHTGITVQPGWAFKICVRPRVPRQK